MSEVVTSRPVNLTQLAEELDGASLSMADDGASRTITCHDETVTQTQLETAIDAHEAAPPPPSAASLLQAQVDELTDLTVELTILLEGNL